MSSTTTGRPHTFPAEWIGSRDPPLATQCVRCKTHYKFLGCVGKFWTIQGQGPFCERCIKKGVTVKWVEL